jgi:hypothetical protein
MATGTVQSDTRGAEMPGVLAWASVAKLSKAKKGKGTKRPG